MSMRVNLESPSCEFSISLFFFLMIRRPPRSTLDRSSAASDVYKRQRSHEAAAQITESVVRNPDAIALLVKLQEKSGATLSLIHISEPTRPY